MADRPALTKETEEIGTRLNQLRAQLNSANMPFMAGLVRAAEQAMQVVYDSLGDSNIPESEL